jgi:RNA 2',3'-cyclic 3'-phosphodiesterase
MRLFVAIEIAPEIRGRITQFLERLRPRIANARWVRPEGMHITLKFLGNVADDKRSAIENALRQIRHAPISIAVEGVGAFPNPRSPRVLWVGINSGPKLSKLAEQVDAAMALLGFEQEKRAFTPHVTLARFSEGKKANISSALSESKLSFGTMSATEFHLYESKLSPKGSQYTKLASFPLT